MKKVIDVLRKLGIFRSGSVSGTYTSAKDRPSELMMDDVYDSKKDLVTKEDFNKKDEVEDKNIQSNRKSSKKGKGVMFWISLVVGVLMLLMMLLVSGFSLWFLISFILWGIFLYSLGKAGAVAMVLWKSISLLVGLFVLTFIFMSVAMPEDVNNKTEGSEEMTGAAGENTKEKDNSTAAKLLREIQAYTDIEFSEIEETDFNWKAGDIELKMINPRKFEAENLSKKEVDKIKSFFISNGWNNGGLGFTYVPDVGDNEFGYAAPYEGVYKGAMCVIYAESDKALKVKCGFGPGGEGN